MSSPAPLKDARVPWWDALPEDFYRQSNDPEIGPGRGLSVRTTAAVDHVARSVLSAALLPAIYTRRGIEQQLRALEHHKALAAQGNSDATFAPPIGQSLVQELRPGKLGGSKETIPYRLLRFHSPFRPADPALAQSYLRLRRNSVAYAQHWYHPTGARPTLIFIHGFILDSYRMNARLFSLRSFYEHGYDVLLYTMPFHGRRVENWEWFSGVRLFANGLEHLNEAMIHAIHDLRVFIGYLAQRGSKQIGVSGFSLGGYTVALLAGVDARLSFYIASCPPVSLIDLLREWWPTGPVLQGILNRHGLTMHELRAAFAVHNPLTYQPKVPAERLLIMGRDGDRFAPPKHLRVLHEHWPGSQMHLSRGDHLIDLDRSENLHLMKSFMDERTAGLNAAAAIHDPSASIGTREAEEAVRTPQEPTPAILECDP